MSGPVRLALIGNESDFPRGEPELELDIVALELDIDVLLDAVEPMPGLVVWLEPEGSYDIGVDELAQLLRSTYADQRIYAITSSEIEEEQVQNMVKNGFTNVLSLADPDLVWKQVFSGYLPSDETLNDLLLVVGNSSLAEPVIPGNFQSENIVHMEADAEALMEPMEKMPAAVLYVQALAGESGWDLSLEEAGQVLLSVYPNSRRYLLYRQEGGFDRPSLVKNGFSDVFVLGVDDRLVKKYLEDASHEVQGIPIFRPVSLTDLNAKNVFGFDLYVHLRMKNKYIKFVKKGTALDEKRLQRLFELNGEVYVPHHQLDEFYKFCAAYLSQIGAEGAGQTEKKAQINAATRDLFANIFRKSKSFAEGDEAMEQVQGIVDEFLGEQHKKAKGKVQGMFADMGSLYEQAADVASLAATFSMVSGLGEPADMATAGLLMDIGLTQLPEIADKSPEEMSFDELDLYKTHPQLSLDLINEKKMKINDSVRALIKNQHEYFNGKGFPKGYSGPKISAESAMLTLAEVIVKRIAERRQETPEEMIRGIHEEMKGDFDNMIIEPSFLKRFIPLFSQVDEGEPP